MEPKLVYLDTSVPNAYFDRRWRERQRVTREWWARVRPSYRTIVSTVLMDEVAGAPAVRRRQLLRLVDGFAVVRPTVDVTSLALGYIEAGILPGGSVADALHIALATMHGADYLVTWNIRHMASGSRRARVREYNRLRGHACPELVTPEELLGPENSERD
ncbi:MAG: type II toxin-antitoxin system VapC family toxin [Myxococcota bacterium]